jgi:hypothetical protein
MDLYTFLVFNMHGAQMHDAQMMKVAAPWRTLACASRISTLDNEVLDDTMKGCSIIVTLQTELHKISAGFWRQNSCQG